MPPTGYTSITSLSFTATATMDPTPVRALFPRESKSGSDDATPTSSTGNVFLDLVSSPFDSEVRITEAIDIIQDVVADNLIVLLEVLRFCRGILPRPHRCHLPRLLFYPALQQCRLCSSSKARG